MTKFVLKGPPKIPHNSFRKSAEIGKNIWDVHCKREKLWKNFLDHQIMMLNIGLLSVTILYSEHVLGFISDRYDMVILNVHELLPLDKGLLIVLPMPLPLILVKLVLEFLQIIKLSN